MSENEAVTTEAPEVTPAEGTETNVATATEAPKAESEATAPTGPSKQEIDDALDQFEELVEGILGTPPAEGQEAKPGNIDPMNGNITEADMASIHQAFTSLAGGTKSHNQAMKRLQDNQLTALTEFMWAVGARAYSLIIVALKNAGKSARPSVSPVAKATVNPTEAHVALGAAHALAVNFLAVGSDVDANWGTMVSEKVNGLRDEVVSYNAYLTEKATWDALSDEDKAKTEEPTAPEVDPIILTAARLARGRTTTVKKAREPKAPGSAATTPRDPSAPRGDILAHIQEVFANLPVGAFLKVSEIAKVGTSQYGAGQASGGAISARIKGPKFAEVSGLSFENDSNGQGVRKTA